MQKIRSPPRRGTHGHRRTSHADREARGVWPGLMAAHDVLNRRYMHSCCIHDRKRWHQLSFQLLTVNLPRRNRSRRRCSIPPCRPKCDRFKLSRYSPLRRPIAGGCEIVSGHGQVWKMSLIATGFGLRPHHLAPRFVALVPVSIFVM